MISSLTIFVNSSSPKKKENQCKEHGPPALIWREAACTTAKLTWASIMKLATRCLYASPSYILRPCLSVPAVRLDPHVSLRHESVVEVVVGEIFALDLVEESRCRIQFSLRTVIRSFRTLFSCVAVTTPGHS